MPMLVYGGGTEVVCGDDGTRIVLPSCRYVRRQQRADTWGGRASLKPHNVALQNETDVAAHFPTI